VRSHNRVKSSKLWIGLFVLSLGSFQAGCTSNADAEPDYVYKAQQLKSTDVVAQVGEIKITQGELTQGRENDFYENEKKLFDLRKSRLEEVLLDRFIAQEAEKAKMSQEDFVNKNVVKGKDEPNTKEIAAFAKERGIPDAQLNDNIKSRIKDFLRGQNREKLLRNYLAKQTSGKKIEVFFTKPEAPVVDVELGDAPVTGNSKGKVTIVEFSDFECPFCGRAAKTVEDLRKEYGSKVKFAFKHFPLPFHKNAKPASLASLCANEQGKFWEYHDKLFSNQQGLGASSFVDWAKELKLNVQKFEECMSQNKFAETIDKDLAQGEKAGVRSTPTFFINGRILTGAQPLAAFKEVIEEELNK